MNAAVDPQATLVARLCRVLPEAEVTLALPLIERIGLLKSEHDAAVVAHNYQVPLVSAAVADFTGDSLAMAQFALASPARTILVCGVRFMAETVKLLCPGKRVLLSASEAGCSLADSIDAEAVRTVRALYPGVPAVAYVNTSAAVKAEVDICCTSANAVRVVRALGAPQVIMLPDQHLAGFVARKTGVEVIAWGGQCEVHTRFTAAEIRSYRAASGATVLAHPECPQAVQAEADFVGSTGAMADFLRERRPQRAMLLTECAMADTVSMECPQITFVRPCNLCRYMKATTLERVAASLETLTEVIEIDPALATRSRVPIARMLEVG
ncbi:MAG: quinolinate synthase NadA [Steroidobacteraceae bacterium]